MRRTDYLLKHIDATQLGIEVAPYFNPAMPKAAGHNVLTLDVFDTQSLRAHARKDPLIDSARVAHIEEVDLVGNACRIGDIVAKKQLSGQIGYIISSHNFEHLPNPIQFLQGCYSSLQPGGMLSMAIPDYRACFDHFRFPTHLAQWLDAYHSDQQQPSKRQIFDDIANRMFFVVNGENRSDCHLSYDDPSSFSLTGDLHLAYDKYLEMLKNPESEYTDVHCSVLFPEIFELMLRDLCYLGLLNWEVVEIS